MAEKKTSYSPFIEAVAGDGTSPPDVRVLTGWLGTSGEEGHARLYLDSGLGTFADIPSDAILYTEEIPNSHPAGARTVWVKQGAELKEGGSAISRAAKFLLGQVQQDFIGARAAAGGALAQIPDTRLCLTVKPGCELSAVDACPSALGCTIDTTIFRQPQFFAFRPRVPITQPGPGTSNLCATINCQTPVLACPDPHPSVGSVCSTEVPALCPDPRFFRAGPRVPITQPGPGTSNLCVTINCQTPVFACPDPHPSVGRVCSTEVPALCPNLLAGFAQACVGQTFQTGHTCPCPPATGQQCVPPPTLGCPPVSQHPPQCCFGQTFQTGIQGCGGEQACAGQTFQTGHSCACPPGLFAVNAGWTSLGCNQQTHYPQCNSNVGVCATRPPCFF